MIKDIQELNFPKIDGEQYATLGQATATLQDMADKFITTTVKIDGDITPDFSFDWEVAFRGEKYIMPLRMPQGVKDSESTEYTVDLTFHHWAIYWLKHRYFFQYTSVDANTVIPDKYIVPLRLNLGDFCTYLSWVCKYWFDDKITVDFNDYKTHPADGWFYDDAPVGVDISYSKIWDVLIKIYDLYGVRWQIVPNGDIDHYTIKIGYPATEVSHIFEYGFEGGLLKTERQVQSDKIANMLMGRGGEKNLPYRYFKNKDQDNDSFPADPDWVPELKDIPFSELRGATFRSYIQGWKTKHYGGASVTSASGAYAPWAWTKGYTDTKFDPVEFVKDDESIARYGELPDALDNNDEIYPTIQGVTVNGLGRVDEVVAVEEITSDDVEKAVENDAQVRTVESAKSESARVSDNSDVPFIIEGNFDVEEGKTANFEPGIVTASGTEIATAGSPHPRGGFTFDNGLQEGPQTVVVIDAATGEERSASGIPAGKYKYRVRIIVKNRSGFNLKVTASLPNPKLIVSTLDGDWSNTWNIWIKDIWGIAREEGETDAQYVERVWRPILGDHEGNDAKIVFSDGWLSTSEDYEFTIVKGGIHFDTSESYNGVPSHWRLTLAKSDADLKSLGLYVPSTMRQAVAGDHFFFTGIELPHQYVVWAEIRLDDYKKDQLKEVKDIKPIWAVSPDKVRIYNRGKGNALIDKLEIGNSIRLADKRFIINSLNGQADYETLYIQSVTYTYNAPTEKEANLLPDVEIVLSDKYETSANPVERVQGEVSALARQVGSISNIEQIVRAVGDKLYLRKDGIPDRSMSPTEFVSLLTSLGFRSGMIGGTGWGIYKDENGRWVIEADRFMARQDLEVNTLVINQVEGQGGTVVESAARMEITRVEETSDGYKCYFDQHEGTVANMFQVGDIAWNYLFTPENQTLKSYRRRVMEVGLNYVLLTKGYEAVTLPDGTSDTGVYPPEGAGIPYEGDALIQRGSYTNPSRRFIKVRDVIGGGYERYIDGLDSVNAEGEEYYFVGRQVGVYNGRPRFFIGDPNGFIEWVNGVLRVNGRIEATSTIGDKTIDQYIKDSVNFDDYKYLAEAIREGASITAGGLFLTSHIKLGEWTKVNDKPVMSAVYAGMNGIWHGNKTPFLWGGGDIVDRFYDENGNPRNEPLTSGYATSLLRMDGTGYFAGGNIVWNFDGSGSVAGGNIKWNKQGAVTIASGVTINLENDQTLALTLSNLIGKLNGLDNLFSAIENDDAKTERTLSWALTANHHENIYAIKVKKNFFSEGGLSALGIGDGSTGSGGGGASYSRLDYWDNYTEEKAGYVLSAKLGYELKQAIDNFEPSQSLEGYATEQWVQSQGYASQTWVQNAIANAPKPNYTFAEIKSKPTTLSGYGITDAMTATSFNNWPELTAGLQQSPSFAGSVNLTDGSWHGIVSVRHRNGVGDGSDYGFYIRYKFGANGSLIFNTQSSGTWKGERTIIDSENFKSHLDGTYMPLEPNEINIGGDDGIVLRFDAEHKALYAEMADGTAANIYATGGLSALGAGDIFAQMKELTGTIDIADIDMSVETLYNFNTFNRGASFYKVLNGNKCMGAMMMFSDSGGHITTQVLFTCSDITEGGASITTETHWHDRINVFVRHCTQLYVWQPWKKAFGSDTEARLAGAEAEIVQLRNELDELKAIVESIQNNSNNN